MTVASHIDRVILSDKFSLSGQLYRDGNCTLKVEPKTADEASKIARDAADRKRLFSVTGENRIDELFAEQLSLDSVARIGLEETDYRLNFGDALLVGEERDYDGSIAWTLVYLC